MATKKPTRAAKPKTAKASTSDPLVIGSRVKALVKGLGMRCDGDLLDAVSGKVAAMIVQAAARVKARGQSTIKPIDL